MIDKCFRDIVDEYIFSGTKPALGQVERKLYRDLGVACKISYGISNIYDLRIEKLSVGRLPPHCDTVDQAWYDTTVYIGKQREGLLELGVYFLDNSIYKDLMLFRDDCFGVTDDISRMLLEDIIQNFVEKIDPNIEIGGVSFPEGEKGMLYIESYMYNGVFVKFIEKNGSIVPNKDEILSDKMASLNVGISKLYKNLGESKWNW